MDALTAATIALDVVTGLVFIATGVMAWKTRDVAAQTRALANQTGRLVTKTDELVQEERTSRESERRELQSGLFRAALIEQVDNCRAWYSVNWYGSAASLLIDLSRVKAWRPESTALTALLGSVDLPGSVVAQLLWLIDITKREIEQQEHTIDSPVIPKLASGQTQDVFKTLSVDWGKILDRLQTIADLLCAELDRRDLSDVADPFRRESAWQRWLQPVVFDNPLDNRTSTERSDVGERGRPGWPTDVAFAAPSPQMRDSFAANLSSPVHCSSS